MHCKITSTCFKGSQLAAKLGKCNNVTNKITASEYQTINIENRKIGVNTTLR